MTDIEIFAIAMTIFFIGPIAIIGAGIVSDYRSRRAASRQAHEGLTVFDMTGLPRR